MQIKRNYLLFTAIVLSVFLCAARAEVKVYAVVDDSKDIYENSRFDYSIIIDGDNKAAQVDIEPLKKFDPQGPTERNSSQRYISIINGNKTVSETKSFIMTYSLMAPKVGYYDIDPVKVTIDGKEYVTNPVPFSVVKAATTDKIDIAMKLSKSKCYVGEPVILRVSWYIRANIAQSIGDFEFNVPVFKNSDIILDDLTDQNSADKVSTVSGANVTIKQRRVKHKGFNCFKVYFDKVLIPSASGEIHLEPSSISTKIAVGSSNTRGNFFDDVFNQREYKMFSAKSKGLTLDVLPLPDEGKPDNFSSLVGKYSISATAEPDKVKVGDPIVLRVIVEGDYLKRVDWDSLKFSSDFEQNFIVSKQKESAKIEDGKKIFKQTIRAKNDSVKSIPEVSISYFDVSSGEYNTAKSAPVEIAVSQNKTLTLADVESLDGSVINTSKKITSEADGIKANLESHHILEDQSVSLVALVRSPVNLVIWIVTLFTLIVSLIVKFIRSNDPEKVIQKKQKQAASKAVRKIKSINGLDSKEAKLLLADAMIGYISDKFNRREASVTSHDCYVVIKDILGEEDAMRYSSIIDNSQASMYSGLNADYNSEWGEAAIGIIKKIEEEIK